jgi:hypothetical protein
LSSSKALVLALPVFGCAVLAISYFELHVEMDGKKWMASHDGFTHVNIRVFSIDIPMMASSLK